MDDKIIDLMPEMNPAERDHEQAAEEPLVDPVPLDPKEEIAALTDPLQPWVKGANFVGMGFAAVVLFLRFNWQRWIDLVVVVPSLLMIPFGFWVRLRFGSRVDFFGEAKTKRPSVDGLIFFGALAPLMGTLYVYQPLRANSLWVYAIPFTIICSALELLFVPARSGREWWVKAILPLVFLGAGWGGFGAINAIFDSSPPRAIPAWIAEKHYSRGRGGPSYEFEVALSSDPSGNTRRTLDVEPSTYGNFKQDDRINLEVSRGILGVPWIRGIARP